MDFLRVFITAPISIAVLFFLSKLIGNKQIANLNIFDYINGITIGSIAAELATSSLDDIPDCAIALAIYAFTVFALALVSQKSVVLRRFFAGKTAILYDKGKLYKKNLCTAKLDLNEFLALLRNRGHFNLDEVESVFLEQNGQISVLPKGKNRPVTPDDLKIRVRSSGVETVVIMDGKVMEKNLKSTGNNRSWLDEQLKIQKTKLKDVFAAVCDGDNNFKIIKTSEDNPTNDVFE